MDIVCMKHADKQREKLKLEAKHSHGIQLRCI